VGLRLAIGRLASSPLFTLFSVISLAAGVAVTTAVYSVVDSLILADSGIAEPDRAVFVVAPVNGRVQHGSLSDLDFEDLKRTQTSFSSLSAGAAITPSVASTANAEILSAEAIEGSYFATLGVTAQLGRVIQPSDDTAAGRVAVISDGFWRRRFAADRGVIGRSLRINGQTFEIIGVADAGYPGAFGIFRTTHLWIPLGTERLIGTRRPSQLPPREQQRLLAFGRLAPDRTIERASAELDTIAARLDRDFPAGGTGGGPAAANTRQWSARSVTAFQDQDTGMRRFGRIIVMLVGLVLLVACTNLANLVLARGAARQGELAVRMDGRIARPVDLGTVRGEPAARGGRRGRIVRGLPGRRRIHDHRLCDGCAVRRIGDAVDSPRAERARGFGRVHLDAAGTGGVRPRAGDSTGPNDRHPHGARHRRDGGASARQAPAHGDPLAGGDRRGILHHRHDVHPLDHLAVTPRSGHRHGSRRGGGLEFRQRRLG